MKYLFVFDKERLTTYLITTFLGKQISKKEISNVPFSLCYVKGALAMVGKTSADVKSSIEFENGGKFLEFWTTVIRWIEADTTELKPDTTTKYKLVRGDIKCDKRVSKKIKPTSSDTKKVKDKPKLKTKIK